MQKVDLDFGIIKYALIILILRLKRLSLIVMISYYITIIRCVGPATGYSINDMINKGWCVKNAQFGSAVGKAQYSCDADPRASLFNNYDEFQEGRVAAHELMYYAYSQRTIFNTVTMDFPGLVTDGYMFSDAGGYHFQIYG
jgi:hypothetical protein